MRMAPLQWASLVVIFLDAVVIAFGFVTGSALLPRSANLVLVVISMALMAATLVFARGAYNFENPTLPAWAVAVAVIAFFGVWGAKTWLNGPDLRIKLLQVRTR